VHAGRLRLSFHLVNSPDDADLVAEALRGGIVG
jgi:selenocysteine lyase/cysteine desulfurase